MSYLTPNISTAASADALSTQRSNAQNKAVAPVTPTQVIQASQASSQQATVIVKNDKDRAVQVPKRAEGSFGPQEEKDSPDQKNSEEIAKPSKVESVDIVA